MKVEFIQINYSDKQKENFPSEMEGNVKLISLDSKRIQGVHGKVYDTSDETVKDYIIRELDSGALGTYYNWFITRNGTIYHITPNNKAGHSSVFKLYSSRMSIAFPEMCPQHKVDVTDLSNIPDKKIISICTELPEDSDSDIILTQHQEYALQNLLSYYFKNVDGLTPKDVLSRHCLTRDTNEKETLGHKAFKTNITKLVVLTSYALMTSRKEPEIELSQSNSLDI